MKPSSLRTWATAILSLLAGISTTWRSMRLALRMRVNMSAMGSVIMARFLSPARLLDARDQSVRGHVAEADPADAELPVDGPRPSAQLAAQPHADALARRELDLLGVLLVRLPFRQLFPEPHIFRFGRHAHRPSRGKTGCHRVFPTGTLPAGRRGG